MSEMGKSKAWFAGYRAGYDSYGTSLVQKISPPKSYSRDECREAAIAEWLYRVELSIDRWRAFGAPILLGR